MSRIIATAAIKGAHAEVARAEQMFKETAEAKGATAAVEFPNTAYYLPIIYALTGVKVEKVEDMSKVLEIAGTCCRRCPAPATGCPTWGIPWMPG